MIGVLEFVSQEDHTAKPDKKEMRRSTVFASMHTQRTGIERRPAHAVESDGVADEAVSISRQRTEPYDIFTQFGNNAHLTLDHYYLLSHILCQPFQSTNSTQHIYCQHIPARQPSAPY